MYSFIQKLHSGWAYIALLLLIIAVVVSLLGFFSKKEFTKTNRTIALLALIGIHLQLLGGLILYFVSPIGLNSLGNMKDAAIRLTSLEHPLINIIAIVLITIGWSKHKKGADSNAKFKAIALFYTLGLILILSRLPWSSWLA
jgi:NADH:ubiquinone oxidoreductase subunit 2 (subunit N)